MRQRGPRDVSEHLQLHAASEGDLDSVNRGAKTTDIAHLDPDDLLRQPLLSEARNCCDPSSSVASTPPL